MRFPNLFDMLALGCFVLSQNSAAHLDLRSVILEEETCLR